MYSEAIFQILNHYIMKVVEENIDKSAHFVIME